MCVGTSVRVCWYVRMGVCMSVCTCVCVCARENVLVCKPCPKAALLCVLFRQ